MPDISTLFWIGSTDNINVGIRYGFTDADAVEVALAEWHRFIDELSRVWTPEAIKGWIEAYYTQRIATLTDFTVKLEIKNRDDRTRGVSYKDRQVITQKIEVGIRLTEQFKKDAEEAKKKTYNVHQFVEPIDMPLVKEHGFEALLKRWYW